MLPTPTDLTYFLTVAKTLNISRASELLLITQPSLSASIRRLEDVVGVKLFIRSKSGVSLTRAGQRLAARTGALLDEWDKMSYEAAKDASEVKGRYIVGCPLDIGLTFLPELLAKLFGMFSDIEIALVHDTPMRVLGDLVTFKIDFGIVVNPFRHPDLVIRTICSDEVRFWVRDGGQPAQSRSGQAVLVYDSSFVGQFAIAQKSIAKITVARVITTASYHMVGRLVAAGVGIGVLPNRIAQGLGVPQMRPLPRNLLCIPHDICLVYRSDLHRTSASREFVRKIEEVLREITATKSQ